MRSRLLAAATLFLVVCCARIPRNNPLDSGGTNYVPPAIAAMADTAVAVNDAVTLHVFASDVNGAIAEYHWSFNHFQSYEISSESTYVKSWTPAEAGTHTVWVRVKDNDGLLSPVDSFDVSVELLPPSVSAPRDTTVRAGRGLRVCASGADNDAGLRFLWSDNGSSFSAAGTCTTFAFADTGARIVKVKALDVDGLESPAATFTVTVISGIPRVIAMNDRAVSKFAQPVRIYASGQDFDGRVVGYYWALGGPDFADSTDTNAVWHSFPDTGAYLIRVYVRDNDGQISSTDSARIRIVLGAPPRISLIADSAVALREATAITATVVDSVSPPAMYYWAFDGIDFRDSTAAGVTQHAFNDTGAHVVYAYVRNAAGLCSAPDSVVIRVIANIPTVSAMDDTSVAAGAGAVTIRAAGADSGGAIAKYYWALDGVSYLDSTTGGTITRSFPAVGRYVVRVKVRDNDGFFSRPDSVVITVTLGSPPTVTPMKDTTVGVNDTALLHAAGSDPDGAIAMYYWAVGGSVYADSSVNGVLRVVFPDTGRYRISVKVRDATGLFSAPAAFTVTMRGGYPTVDFSRADTVVSAGQTIRIAAVGSDPDRLPVRYIWSRDGAAYSDTTSVGTRDTAFAAAGVYYLYVKVIDASRLVSAPDTMTIAALDVNVLLSPADNAALSLWNTWLVWKKAVGFSFRLYLGTDSAALVAQGAGFSGDTSFFAAGLAGDTVYFWKVALKDSRGRIYYSPMLRFMTPNHKPSVPLLTSPDDNSVLNDPAAQNVSFTWSASTDSEGCPVTYTLYLDKNDPPATAKTSGLEAAQYSMSVLQLDTAVYYYWRVAAFDGADTSLSEVRRFAVSMKTIGYGDMVTAFLGVGDRHAYRFSGNAGDSVMVRMQDGDCIDYHGDYCKVEIVDPAGNLLDTNVTACNSAVFAVLPSTGVYRIYCEDDNHQQSFQYQCRLLCLNDLKQKAAPLSYGNIVSSFMEKLNIRAYKFAGAAGDVVTVRMEDGDCTDYHGDYCAVVLATSADSVLQTATDPCNAQILDYGLPATGTYYIFCQDDNYFEQFSYTLRLLRREQ